MASAKQDIWIAGGLFVGGLVLLAAGVYIPRATSPNLLIVPLAISCAGIVFRRRAPILTLILGLIALTGDLLLGPTLGTVLIFTDNIYAAALYGPARLSRALLRITPVVTLFVGAIAGYVAGDWRASAIIGVQAALIGPTPVITAVIVRQHRDQAEAERTRAEQIARLAELDRRTAITVERTRMARELHDLVANHFSAIAIQSAGVLARPDLEPRTVRAILESIRENSVQGMAEMRTMIGLLRAEAQDEDVPTRRRLADAGELVERSGLPATLTVNGSPRELPAAVDLAAYRILQESLTNALKHGTAPADVTIDYGTNAIKLTIDNPLGDQRQSLPGAGAGLVGMRERATLVGGTFEAGAHQNGWRVHAELPIQEETP
ncbi:two-component sensor histidine kinase [Acrocarpospora phusangensis]|uniref:histidine kinase n=1 Tax=Acrocarpospora phusangensis TaxID=1070424 RepID=A0A919Q9B1_9ACTN|nr:histidine kinase [Acrocarpospora phusangensis]GIH24899.1 two-component sensor histidine kinase [Acrocarpospora phusangensis]